MTQLTNNLLEKAKTVFANLRGSTLEATQILAEIKNLNVWTEVSENWGSYVETELGISQSFASKLLIVHDHYLNKAGFSPEKINGIDYEKLYLATKLEGTAEEQVAKAQTLTRRELKEERNDNEEMPHEHQPVCRICHIKL